MGSTKVLVTGATWEQLNAAAERAWNDAQNDDPRRFDALFKVEQLAEIDEMMYWASCLVPDGSQILPETLAAHVLEAAAMAAHGAAVGLGHADTRSWDEIGAHRAVFRQLVKTVWNAISAGDDAARAHMVALGIYTPDPKVD